MKLAVASCARIQDIDPQTVWAEIRAERPDALLLLGDNIYLSRQSHDDPQELAAELRRRYAAQFAEPNFAALLADLQARGAALLAIYDDHDFLGNNRCGGDHEPSLREAARSEFVRAFAPPTTGGDVYHVRRLGAVEIVVLDERFYRRAPRFSASDRDAILGPAQWAWLEAEVAASGASFLVIASSTTLHAFAGESWERYPAAFERLSRLLRGRAGAFVVSGDIHHNAAYDDRGVLEIVTSGVARNGFLFWLPRRNYGIFTFDATKLRVELRSLKPRWRFDFTIPLSGWALP